MAASPPRTAALLLGWTAMYGAIVAALHWYTPVPWDTDTAYHAAVGRLIRRHGLLTAFPWTPYSWLAEHYSDKELLFHLLFAPLSSLHWITASRIVGVIAGTAIIVTIYLVLRAEGVRYAPLWALVPLATSSVFVFRFMLIRPFLLSITLALVVVWAAARGRLTTLAVASALYPWAYVAWYLPVVLVGIVELARLLGGERPRWRPAAVVLGSIAVGVLLHPNAANLPGITWIVVADVLVRNAWGARAGIELGGELSPLTVVQWAKWMLACTAMAVTAAVLAWRQRRTTAVPLAFALAAVAFGALSVASAKFVEYFVPLSVSALALGARPLRCRHTAVVVLLASAIYAGGPTLTTVHGLGTRQEHIPAALEVRLRALIPEGSQVFTCEWEDTGTLMLALPERRFLVALDPTLLLVHDPRRYELWYALPRSARPRSADAIRTTFGARFVVCAGDDPRWFPFFDQLGSEPGVVPALMTDRWVIFDLGRGAPWTRDGV